MGILERREREREEVRRKIMDAARDLFTSEGYDRVTMRRIADAIEYSPTTIYNHFVDKDDLVQALCDEDFQSLLGAVSQGPLPSDPLDVIRHIGRAYAAFGLQNPNHYRFMFMTAAKFETPHEVTTPGQQSFGLLLQVVQAGVASGRLAPIEPLAGAQILWTAIHGAVSLLITLPAECWPQGPVVDDLVGQVIENSLRGLTAARPVEH